MNIPLDQQWHFLVGYGATLTVTLLTHSILLGMSLAMFLEGIKIVCFDIKKPLIDWNEKIKDILFQSLGATLGAFFMYFFN